MPHSKITAVPHIHISVYDRRAVVIFRNESYKKRNTANEGAEHDPPTDVYRPYRLDPTKHVIRW